LENLNWENETIKIETKNNQEYLCKKVVLTIPVALLQKQTINFLPTFLVLIHRTQVGYLF
jgi:hypothetical protein